MFRRLVKMFTSGRAPFAGNKPVPSAVDLSAETTKKNLTALNRFLDDGAWTKEAPDATHR